MRLLASASPTLLIRLRLTAQPDQSQTTPRLIRTLRQATRQLTRWEHDRRQLDSLAQYLNSDVRLRARLRATPRRTRALFAAAADALQNQAVYAAIFGAVAVRCTTLSRAWALVALSNQMPTPLRFHSVAACATSRCIALYAASLTSIQSTARSFQTQNASNRSLDRLLPAWRLSSAKQHSERRHCFIIPCPPSAVVATADAITEQYLLVTAHRTATSLQR